MPLVTKELSLVDYARGVLLAPFALMLAVFIARWWAILLAGIGMGVSLLLAVRQGWDFQQLRQPCIIFTGTIIFIWFVAVLLATRDYLFSNRLSRHWEPDQQCVEVSVGFAKCLIGGDYAGAFKLLDVATQESTTPKELEATWRAAWPNEGVPCAVLGATEMPLDAGNAKAATEGEIEVAAIARVLFRSSTDGPETEPHQGVEVYMRKVDDTYSILTYRCADIARS